MTKWRYKATFNADFAPITKSSPLGLTFIIFTTHNHNRSSFSQEIYSHFYKIHSHSIFFNRRAVNFTFFCVSMILFFFLALWWFLIDLQFVFLWINFFFRQVANTRIYLHNKFFIFASKFLYLLSIEKSTRILWARFLVWIKCAIIYNRLINILSFLSHWKN